MQRTLSDCYCSDLGEWMDGMGWMDWLNESSLDGQDAWVGRDEIDVRGWRGMMYELNQMRWLSWMDVYITNRRLF